MPDKIPSPEIIKLMDKMTQNPTSRLFVPLAEEYLKCDMVEEALIVLVEGIKNHPSYVAARVMLGKIYLQKNQIPEAQSEFEQVITANPENILAHKKLASIYQGQGQIEKALESCKKVLAIDPSDKEAKGLAGVLEKALASGAQSEKRIDFPDASAAVEPSGAMAADTIEIDSSIAPPDPAAVIEEPPAGALLQTEPMRMEPAFPVEEGPVEISNDPFKDLAEPIVPSAPEERPAASENEVQEAVSSAAAPDPTGPEGSPAIEENSWEVDKTVVAGFEIPPSPSEAPSPPSLEAQSAEENQMQGKEEEPLLSTTLASLYMSQGHYKEAAEVYEKLLARDSSDEESRQGLEKALQHLAPGREAEASSGASSPEDSKTKKTRRLQSWLDSIRKRE